MRRNILTYKAPPHNEGYDLVCIHPDPRTKTEQVRVQVKSRYATDCDLSIDVNDKTFSAFDFLVAVFLNIGNYFDATNPKCIEGRREPEFYTFPVSWVRKHYDKSRSRQKVRLKNMDVRSYKNDLGFELIAGKLGIGYPSPPEP